MPVIAPQTDVYLLKVPLEINDINQLDFSSKQAQFNYFNSLPKYELTEFTYQRKDGIIRVPLVFDELLSYNYVMYRNNEFSDKWFYAFITDLEFKSPNSTDISIKTDTWQSWMFDISFKPSYVEREHVNDDSVGAHTIPEGLELGEMIVNGNTVDFGAEDRGDCIIVDVSMIESQGQWGTLSYQFDDIAPPMTLPPIRPTLNGVPSGLVHLVVGYDSTSASLDEVIEVFNYAGMIDAVINCYVVPRSLISGIYKATISANVTGQGSKTASHIGIPYETNNQTDIKTQTLTRPTNLAGYVPRNNKMKTYPFSYFTLSNNSGSSYQYHYEDFSGDIQFKLEGTLCPSGNVKALPINYKNNSGNAMDFGVTGAKFPIASWHSDSYTNWLTQNAVNLQMEQRSALLGVLAGTGQGFFQGRESGTSGGGLVGAFAGLGQGVLGLNQTVYSQLMAKHQASMIPDQVHGNLNTGDLVYAKNRGDYTYIPMCVKPEISRTIDDYFSQFGYKCDRVKLPNITGRRNWNYVKTVGCYIAGDIPQGDMQEIKNMFDRGITIWHNPSTFADYSQNNDII